MNNTKDILILEELYENLRNPEFSRHYAETENFIRMLEHKITGLTTYFGQLKRGYENNPNDTTYASEIKALFEHLKEPLYPYQEFRD